jgi:hypothetical protein
MIFRRDSRFSMVRSMLEISTGDAAEAAQHKRSARLDRGVK